MSFGLSAAAIGAISVGAGAAGGIYSGIRGMGEGQGLKRMSMRAMDEENPFGEYRDQYAKMLEGLMDNPGEFLDSPLFKGAFDLGTQGVMRGMAAKGEIGSGNMATGLQSFGMNMAFGALQDEKKFLAHLAGADQDPNFAPMLQGRREGSNMLMQGIGGIGESVMSIFG
jgi:hypothetical protein